VSFFFYTLLTKRVGRDEKEEPLPQASNYQGWIGQAYNCPQSWITTPNTFDWYTGVQDHIIPDNYIPPETHVGWLNPAMSAPFGEFEVSRNDAALQDITSYSNTTVPGVGYTERQVIQQFCVIQV
jgi:hypothetical protein